MSLIRTPLKSYRKYTVFALDDEVDYLETFRIAARRFDDLSFYTSDSDENRVEWILSKPLTRFVLFFLDIRFHDEKRGFEICRAIRNEPMIKRSPIIFMSTYLDLKDVDEGFDAGANSYFYKSTGTNNRIKAVHGQLSYWLDKANFSPISTKGERTTISAERLIGDSYLNPNLHRLRAAPIEAIESLYEDILPALLRDARAISGMKIQESLYDKIHKSISRLREIFTFVPEAFDKRTSMAIYRLSLALSEWADLGKAGRPGFEAQQKKCLERARRSRIDLRNSFRGEEKTILFSEHFSQLDIWIWDVFSEIADSPSFPKLYLSLKRFRASVFH